MEHIDRHPLICNRLKSVPAFLIDIKRIPVNLSIVPLNLSSLLFVLHLYQKLLFFDINCYI